MTRQSGYVDLPAILLTLALWLLVLALGFVVGRVVVARAYLQMAPKFESVEATQLERDEAQPEPMQRVPGEVYVPPPAPPEPIEEDEEEGDPSELAAVEPAIEGAEAPTPETTARTTPATPRGSAPEPSGTGADRPRGHQPITASAPAPPERSEADAGKYAIQVGLFTSRQGARRVVDELARTGYQARIEPERRDSQELYRVLTGRYQTEYAARKGIEQLRREGFDAFLVER